MKRHYWNQKGFTRPLIIGIIVIIFASAAVLFFQEKEKETIKIGAIISLTGSGSHLVDLRDAMLMAVGEINAQGGVNSRKIELLIEDSQTNPDAAKRAFERIENGSKKPVIYVSALSSIGMAVKPLAEKNKAVLVGLNTSAPEFTENGTWAFRHFFTAREEARVSQQILNNLHINSLGIIYLDDPFGNSIVNLLEKKFIEKGGKVFRFSYPNDVEDLTTQIEAIQALPAVYLVGFVKHQAMALRQLRKNNFPGIILAAGGTSNPRITEMPEAEGIYLAAPIVYSPVYPFAKSFKKKFETRFGKTMSHNAANGYDFVKILAGLIEGQEISRQSIKQIFAQGFMYSGVLGDQELKSGSQEIEIPYILPAFRVAR